MTPTDDFDLALLERRFAGEASPEESARLEAWIAADPARRDVVDAFRRAWEGQGAASPEWDVSAMYGQLTGRIRAHERQNAEAKQPRLVRTMLGEYGDVASRSWARRLAVPLAAAAMVLALVCGAFVWSRLGARLGGDVAASRTPMREFATGRGERVEVKLTDATRVLLAPASKLRIPADFGRSSREVYLDGEAFFEVTHDSLKPFNVHAAHAVARDLGTKFSVTTVDGTVQVVVAEGSVALQRDSAPDTSGTLLQRGDLGQLAPTGETMVRRGVDLDRYLDWTTGRLVFEDVPLAAATPRLERWYDVHIVLADSAMAARRLSATFKDQPASQVLDALALLLDARVTREGNTATFARRHPR